MLNMSKLSKSFMTKKLARAVHALNAFRKLGKKKLINSKLFLKGAKKKLK
jgi:hypothetical protein